MWMSRHKGVPPPSQRAAESVRNIVIFGESGVGKSSLINLITGQSIAATSNSVTGCTSRHTKYDLQVDGASYALHDTPGLNEGTNGTAPAKVAEENLKQLLHDLLRSSGVHLLMYCVRASRLRKTLLRNYNLLYSEVCRRKVPIVVVVTGLEKYGGEMADWWTANEAELARLDMRFDGHACVTTLNAQEVNSSILKQRCQASRHAVLSLIGSTCAREGWTLKTPTDIPIIALHTASNFPEPHLLAPAKSATGDVSPCEGSSLVNVKGKSFFVYYIHGQHLRAGTRFKKRIASREADLLIICASVHSSPGTSRKIAAAFHESYGRNKRPLLIVVKDALSDEEAQNWWNTSSEDTNGTGSRCQKRHHQSDRQKPKVTVHALPPLGDPHAPASVARLQQTIQACSWQSADVSGTGCFGWLAVWKRSPKLSSGNASSIIPPAQEDCLMDSKVWSLGGQHQL